MKVSKNSTLTQTMSCLCKGVFCIWILVGIGGCESAAERAAREEREQAGLMILMVFSVFVSTIAGAIGGAIGGSKRGWNMDIDEKR